MIALGSALIPAGTGILMSAAGRTASNFCVRALQRSLLSSEGIVLDIRNPRVHWLNQRITAGALEARSRNRCLPPFLKTGPVAVTPSA